MFPKSRSWEEILVELGCLQQELLLMFEKQRSDSLMAQKSLFKKCAQYGAEMAQADEHGLCVLCLDEGHHVSNCKVCQQFTNKTHSERASKLKAALGEKAL